MTKSDQGKHLHEVDDLLNVDDPELPRPFSRLVLCT